MNNFEALEPANGRQEQGPENPEPLDQHDEEPDAQPIIPAASAAVPVLNGVPQSDDSDSDFDVLDDEPIEDVAEDNGMEDAVEEDERANAPENDEINNVPEENQMNEEPENGAAPENNDMNDFLENEDAPENNEMDDDPQNDNDPEAIENERDPNVQKKKTGRARKSVRKGNNCWMTTRGNRNRKNNCLQWSLKPAEVTEKMVFLKKLQDLRLHRTSTGEMMYKPGCKEFLEIFSQHEHLFRNNKITIKVWNDSKEYNKKLGTFNVPHLFKTSKDLRLRAPDINFQNVEEFLWESDDVLVINSMTRETTTMSMKKFLDAFNGVRGDQALNMLSLEVSKLETINKELEEVEYVKNVSMVSKLERALAARKDKLMRHRNDDNAARELLLVKKMMKEMPRYTKFVLVSMEKSFTDTHVDMSASSVFYHVDDGRKIFYVAPPTEANLKMYKEVELGKKDVWLLEEFWDQWQRIEIKKGQTAMLPSGWLHFVWTPEDSIVFGGNFLREEDLERHIEFTELEIQCQDHGTAGLDSEFLFRKFYPLLFAYLQYVVLPDIEEFPLVLDDERLTALRVFAKLEGKPHEDWMSTSEQNRIVEFLRSEMAKVAIDDNGPSTSQGRLSLASSSEPTNKKTRNH
ncbi:hypothetical protein L5515_018338 [Caenorhabditis briggsae]|uniref:JmjC domain-containing protein n=1 Tax=Caenorhabditis briggsae TaxID=6238 RepID=A0AAE9FB55_CAEBR|nr:hypothetical protein L5515_018338 [Caenorhabditis briggsae]